MAVVTTQQTVAALYVAIFNRAPDQAGLTYWTAQITAGQSFASVVNGFTQHEVFTAGIGALANADFVNALYTNILGSAGDAAGVAFWTAALAAGQTKAQVLASFVSGALTIDIPAQLAAGNLTAAEAAAATIRQQTLTNKADTGIYFANTLGASSNLNPLTVSTSKAGLEADPIYNASKAAIANVTSTAASVQTAKDAIAVAAGTTNPAASLLGGNVTLTAAVDNITGTAAADTYTAVIDGAATTTLTAADKINGGAGIDTLNVTVTAGTSATNGADISNVEILNVRNIGGGAVVLDVASTPGATTVVSDRSTGTLTVSNLAAGATVGLKGNAVTALGAVTGSYVATATAANITIDGGTAAATAALTVLDGVALTSATIASTGAANTVASINFGTGAGTADNVTAVTINATTNLTAAGGIVGLKTGVTTNTLTVAGAAASVNVGTLDATIGTVTASGLTTGGLTATLSNNVNVKFTGGAGNDVITSNGVLLAAGASVDAGAGTADRLVLTGAIANSTAGKASAALYKGFEELRLNNIAQDVSIFTGSAITKLVLDGGADITGATAAQAANIQVLNSGAITVGITGASTVGQLDTVALTADDGVATTSTIAFGTTLGLAGVETLQITAVDNVTIGGLTNAPDLTSVKLLGAGTTTLVTGNVNFAANTTIDGSAATGSVNIDASGAQATALVGLSIKGGAGNDVLVGSAKADAIVGGAGNDLLVSTNGTVGVAATATTAATVTAITGTATAGDTLTGGAGNDNFAIGHITGTSNATILASVSSITDLNLGTNVVAGAVDGLWFNTTTPLTAVTVVTLSAAQQTAVTGAADLLTAVNLVLAAAAGVNNVATFTYGTDTYLVTNADGATTAAFTAASDNLVKITGVTGTLDASDIHFV
jgi:hypothetical protein